MSRGLVMVAIFSMGFGAFMFVFALTVQDGLHNDALITLQQSGLALGVATLGTLYLTLQPHGYPRAFAMVEYIQMGIVALLAVGAAILPRFTSSSTSTPVIDA